MADLQPGRDGYYHPASEADIQALVRRAAHSRLQLRLLAADVELIDYH